MKLCYTEMNTFVKGVFCLFADSHTHSCFSFDGAVNATPDEMCRAAISAGLTDLAITDHCDVNGEVEGFYHCYDRQTAFFAIMEAKETYKNRLRISYGIELGQATQYPAYAKELLSSGSFDFVLGSLHNLCGVPDFYYIDFSKDFPQKLIDCLFNRYVAELTELCSIPGIHSLAHITYPLRYLAEGKKSLNLSCYEEQFRELFRQMIEKDIALEVNTSTLSCPLGETMPSVSLLKLYRECGGTLITVGSDAHSTERIGSGIRETYRMLSDNDFSKVTVYYNGKPEYFSIV